MRYEVLGTTGIEVSRLCLGSMMFGRLGNRDHEDCLRIIHHALDAGINFIDTADVYSAGESEEIVGEALRGRRDDIIVATKSYFSVQDGPAVSRRGSTAPDLVAATFCVPARTACRDWARTG
jgi:aryl-alcohol dehydrogenase-like predicted oxidoreductase